MTYRTLDIASLRSYIAKIPELAARIGPDPYAWDINEVSDGNLNSVHLVDGPLGGICVKQGLPHVRVLPSWKMPLDHTLFEARYMRETAPFIGGMAPALLHEDRELALIAIESLAGHAVLRTALIEGTAPAGFSDTIGRYVARTGFLGSSIAAPFEKMAQRLQDFSGNTALARITVDLVLTDPFGGSERNRIDHADLDIAVTRLQADQALKDAAGQLQERFLTTPQTLLHGDLHTGSIMLRRAGQGDPDTRVIDGEFAHCGPIGFDCGLYLANLALHALANPRAAETMRAEATLFQRSFDSEFRDLWRRNAGRGDLYALTPAEVLSPVMDRYLEQVRRDTQGFMGAEMIRRTIGFAHVADFDLCPDHETRMDAMRAALASGRRLMLAPATLATPDALWALVAP